MCAGVCVCVCGWVCVHVRVCAGARVGACVCEVYVNVCDVRQEYIIYYRDRCFLPRCAVEEMTTVLIMSAMQ